MRRQSKRFKFLAEQVLNLAPLDVHAAVAKLKSLEPSLPKGIKPCKFDQTVEVAVRLFGELFLRMAAQILGKIV